MISVITDKTDNNCETCNGTGLVSFFQGESRFLLTQEECPDCYGTGLRQSEQSADLDADKTD